MKFEKKVILGSIGGFITTALGIIAVFFPSVFNLEKKTMEEINIFIKSQADVDNLRKAIEKNRGKLVKLDVTYCYDTEKAIEKNETGEYSNEIFNLYPHLGENRNNIAGTFCILIDKGCEIETNPDNKSTKYLKDGVFLIGGTSESDGVILPNEGVGALGFYKDSLAEYLAVPYEAKGKYDWKISYDKSDNNDISGCVIKENKDDSVSWVVKETLSGVFYIDDEDATEQTFDGYFAPSTVLEPFNKKDLKMRDY
ncbi:hypothetical protein [Campylobacter sp. RM12647]|uniref:hypothetical protein n=1 Tax=Campylobacter sp. RM12647 TaxID=2735737 RepID=UPI001D7C5530|nr:hypothetical protein [Campylobacter sp. RM12647]